MQIKLELIVAVCENMGIGIKGNLPWRLKTEMEYFTRLTSTTKDVNKKNVVIMGRKTWDSIPDKYKPLSNRINVILSQTLQHVDDGIICTNLSEAIKTISQPPLKDKVERIWVIGGSSVYKEALNSPYFSRLYITRIKKNFECDTFFPETPQTLKQIRDPDVLEGIMTENGIEFHYEIYEKV